LFGIGIGGEGKRLERDWKRVFVFENIKEKRMVDRGMRYSLRKWRTIEGMRCVGKKEKDGVKACFLYSGKS
jgi:hypothetical protein